MPPAKKAPPKTSTTDKPFKRPLPKKRKASGKDQEHSAEQEDENRSSRVVKDAKNVTVRPAVSSRTKKVVHYAEHTDLGSDDIEDDDDELTEETESSHEENSQYVVKPRPKASVKIPAAAIQGTNNAKPSRSETSLKRKPEIDVEVESEEEEEEEEVLEQEEEEEEEEEIEETLPTNDKIKKLHASLLQRGEQMHQKSLAKRQAALRSVYDEAKSSMIKHKTGSTGNTGQTGPGWDSLMRGNKTIGVRLDGMIQDIRNQIESEEKERFRDKKLSEHKEKTDQLIETITSHVNESLAPSAETIIATIDQIEAFPVKLQKAKKRAIRQTEKKLKEQYEIAERNVTAKGYIQSVARIMGIDLTPFRE